MRNDSHSGIRGQVPGCPGTVTRVGADRCGYRRAMEGPYAVRITSSFTVVNMAVQAGGDHTHAHTLTTHAHAHTHTWIAPCHLPDWDALLNFCRMLPLGETGKRVEGPGVFLTTTCKPTILLMKKLGMWESKFFIPFSLGQGLYLLLFIQQVLSLSHSFTHTHTHTHTHHTHKETEVHEVIYVKSQQVTEKAVKVHGPPATPQVSDTQL